MAQDFGGVNKGYAFAAQPKVANIKQKNNNTGDFIEYPLII